MKDYNKIIIIFLLGIVLCLNIELVLSNNKLILDNPKKDYYDYNINLHISGFWNTTPIEIDGTATGVGAHNWTWAENQPWCSGSGIFADPYIIENMTIQGNNFSSCITIKNSDSYFILKNSMFYDSASYSHAGIKLNNVTNGILIDNNCSINVFQIILVIIIIMALD